MAVSPPRRPPAPSATETQIGEALAAFAGLRFVRINLELDLDAVSRGFSDLKASLRAAEKQLSAKSLPAFELGTSA